MPWEVAPDLPSSSDGFDEAINQSLAPLGGFFRYFRGFVNYTRTEVTGVNAGNFTGYNHYSWNRGAF